MTRRINLAAAFLVAAGLPGCAKTARPAYSVRGAVTFKGQPVPSGAVLFMPDASRGNTGPMAAATIANGQYDLSTATGAKVFGGPYTISIQAFKGPQTDEKPEGGGRVFPPYEESRDLPTADTTLDFHFPLK